MKQIKFNYTIVIEFCDEKGIEYTDIKVTPVVFDDLYGMPTLGD